MITFCCCTIGTIAEAAAAVAGPSEPAGKHVRSQLYPCSETRLGPNKADGLDGVGRGLTGLP